MYLLLDSQTLDLYSSNNVTLSIPIRNPPIKFVSYRIVKSFRGVHP